MHDPLPPKPQSECPVCHRAFQYEPNSDWNPELAKLSKLLVANSYWMQMRHADCERRLLESEQEDFARKAREEEASRARRKLKEYGFPKTLMGKTFENFQCGTGQKEALAALRAWTFNPVGILLEGPPGRGKSHLMAAFAAVWSEMQMSVVFQNVSELLDTLRQGYDDDSFHGRIAALTSPKLRILILDDLGAEKPTEWGEEKIYRIIESRIQHQLPTFVTTNCSAEELEKKFHPRILSRLREACVWITTGGDDFRSRIAQGRIQKAGPAEIPGSPPRRPPTSGFSR